MCNLFKDNLKYFLLIVLSVAIDQASKYIALKQLIVGMPIAVLPFLNWSLNYNKGISFGLFNQGASIVPVLLIIMVCVLILGLLIFLYKTASNNILQKISLALIIGGAIGNLIDRVLLGHVVDFIDFYIGSWHWYTFNIADCFICIGAAMLALQPEAKKAPLEVS